MFNPTIDSLFIVINELALICVVAVAQRIFFERDYKILLTAKQC
jgi:hypothetical protein